MKNIKSFVLVLLALVFGLIFVSCVPTVSNDNEDVIIDNPINPNGGEDDNEDVIIDFIPSSVFGTELTFSVTNVTIISNKITFTYNGIIYELEKYKFDDVTKKFNITNANTFTIYNSNGEIGYCNITLKQKLNFAFHVNNFENHNINLQINATQKTLIINID